MGAKGGGMSHREVLTGIFAVVVLLALGLESSAVAQVTVRKQVSTSQQRDVQRIRELMAEVEVLMSGLPADLQADLRNELHLAPADTTAVSPVSPVEIATTGRGDEVGFANAVGGTVMVLDTRGDGFDLSGRATIRAGGSLREVVWVRPNTDDVFLMIDALGLRRAGFELFDRDGERIEARLLVGGGMRLRTVDGMIQAIDDPWQLLGSLDSNSDGQIDQQDAAWLFLSVFRDRDGNGRVGADEIQSLMDTNVRGMSLEHGSPQEDSRGNSLTQGTYMRTRGEIAPMAGVTLRR